MFEQLPPRESRLIQIYTFRERLFKVQICMFSYFDYRREKFDGDKFKSTLCGQKHSTWSDNELAIIVNRAVSFRVSCLIRIKYSCDREKFRTVPDDAVRFSRQNNISWVEKYADVNGEKCISYLTAFDLHFFCCWKLSQRDPIATHSLNFNPRHSPLFVNLTLLPS